MKRFRISTVKDAANVLKHFNVFHDGFIKKIEITSKDEVTPEKSQICEGLFEVTLIIAHYNYDQGQQPYNRLIRFAFTNVCNINMDFRDVGSCDWNINELKIREADNLLLFTLQRNQYDGANWNIQEHDLFLFESVEISEE